MWLLRYNGHWLSHFLSQFPQDLWTLSFQVSRTLESSGSLKGLKLSLLLHSSKPRFHFLKLGQCCWNTCWLRLRQKKLFNILHVSCILPERTHIFPGVSFTVDLLFEAFFVNLDVLGQFYFYQCFNFPNKTISLYSFQATFPCFHPL